MLRFPEDARRQPPRSDDCQCFGEIRRPGQTHRRKGAQLNPPLAGSSRRASQFERANQLSADLRHVKRISAPSFSCQARFRSLGVTAPGWPRSKFQIGFLRSQGGRSIFANRASPLAFVLLITFSRQKPTNARSADAHDEPRLKFFESSPSQWHLAVQHQDDSQQFGAVLFRFWGTAPFF